MAAMRLAVAAPLQPFRSLLTSDHRPCVFVLRQLRRRTMATQQAFVNTEAEEGRIWQQFHDHQKNAVKLSHLEESRTLLDNKRSGILSTISHKYESFPFGSMVDFASDEKGRPILAISTLSPHTKDLHLNPKCSLLVPKDPSDKSDTTITIIGEATMLMNQDKNNARSIYLKKHPHAFWVDFDDFRIARIEPMKVRFVTGLVTGQAAVADLEGDDFQAAGVHPISQFSAPIASHMNKDHSDDTKAIVEHVVKISVDTALMIDLDRLGFNVKATIQGRPVKMRVPFPRPAEDRKDVKTLIVEMLNNARLAA